MQVVRTTNKNQTVVHMPKELEDERAAISSDELGQESDLEEETDKTAIVDHLLFHKALISEEEDSARFDKYMDLIEQLEKGFRVTIKDPFDRSIAITFELAIEHQLNPWDIDLAKFSTEYLKHVKKEHELDLITAGRIILMAWMVLKLQSDEVLLNAQKFEEHEPEEDEYWPEPDGDWYANDDDFDYTTAVITSPSPPLQEMVWRKGKRRVSLVELINAFEEVKREAELQRILTDKRSKQREADKKMYRKSIGDKLHKENLNEEIRIIYERICKYDGQPIPIKKIYEDADLEDRITAMVSSLYLAHDQRIKLWQRNFPFGEIYIKNLHKELAEAEKDSQELEGDDDGDEPKRKKQPRLVVSRKKLAA